MRQVTSPNRLIPPSIGPTVALYRPQIPPNTGNIARLCVGIKSDLYIIGKPAFSLDDKHVRRAGLDHWNLLKMKEFPTFKKFYLSNCHHRIFSVTKGGQIGLWETTFKADDIILFGNEQNGLPPKMLKFLGPENSVKIPMLGEVRSLNLANAVSVVAYEFLRQMFNKKIISYETLHEPPRTFYKKVTNS